ncbi:hypothetical protein GCM10008164_42170 [Achromobacter xylosoxidans]|nr:hypothetical protein GCM10008164_42170 [Achromobacter xylosoxidans]
MLAHFHMQFIAQQRFLFVHSSSSARSAITNRKTPRKPQKAARAAGLGRAP